MEDIEKMLEKVKVNGQRPALFEPYEVLPMIQDAGEDWRIIWEELPTLSLFDHLYAVPDKYTAFIYQDTFFEYRLTNELTCEWVMFTQEGQLFLDWILDHPPFDCCVPVADLFRHSQNIEIAFSPWTLFEHITGYVGGDVAQTLLSVGGNDAVTLGRALEAWGEYADIVDPFIQLVNHYANE